MFKVRQITRQMDRLSITYCPHTEEYLVSVQWVMLDGSTASWPEQYNFFTFEHDELEEFSVDFIRTELKMKRLIAKQEARRAARSV
jgi:hypothetical protein